MAGHSLNVLTLTATEAQNLLTESKITSVDLVLTYLDQIEKHNRAGLHLNIMISVAPKDKVLKAAHRLDNERKSGKVRGPLHGIPFITKDVFVTHPDLGLPTTAGAPAFRSAEAKRTAPLIRHLVENEGMILLGKANLTEFCGLKQKPYLTPGWSPAGGQTQSPYIFGGVEDGDKILGHSSGGGSSSGPAAGVAAGFAPLSIGTEVCGSVITPANRAGVYALKCSFGEVNDEGCFKYTDCIDHVGGMAKSAADLALFIAAIMERPEPFETGDGFQGMKVAFTDPKVWRLNDDMCAWPGDTREQMEKGYASAISTIKSLGARVTEAIDLPAPDVFTINGKSPFYEITFYQLYNIHLPDFFKEFSKSEVWSLEDIIAYNEEHKDECMPPSHPRQDELHDLLSNSRTAEESQQYLTELRRRGKEALDEILKPRENDVLVAFADSPLVMYSSSVEVQVVHASRTKICHFHHVEKQSRGFCALTNEFLVRHIGYPVACVPLGTVKYSERNERPYGLCMLAEKGKEEVLLRFLAAWEKAWTARPIPRPLDEAHRNWSGGNLGV